MSELVGYRLIRESDGKVIEQWGGTWGQCPGIPNPIRLPSGLAQVHAPTVGEVYEDLGGETSVLEPWMMDEPGGEA